MATPRAVATSRQLHGALTLALVNVTNAGLKSLMTFENLKSGLFYYVLLSTLLKAYRHALARGVVQTLEEGRRAVARVRSRSSKVIC